MANFCYDPIVLMYHGIVSEDCLSVPERTNGAQLYDVSRQRFCEQLAWIRDNNFSVSLLDEKLMAANERTKFIVFTFDDGEFNNFQNAFPILCRFRFPAYFFVTVNCIGKHGYMDWEHLKNLRDAGMVVGSHGLNHKILTGLKTQELKDELYESKAILEKNLMINVDSFSVPRGFCDVGILQVAKEAGYKQIFTSEPSNDGIILGIPRLAVRNSWALDRFCMAVEGKTPICEKVIKKIIEKGKIFLGVRKYDKIRSFLLGKRRN